MRGRGLKQAVIGTPEYLTSVAPHAGAWIETLYTHISNPHWEVAPHAGAWIETFNYNLVMMRLRVAPHAGAWIETILLARRGRGKGRPPCGGVD